MRILVINYEYPPIGGGGGFVTRDILEYLVKCGHHVSIITTHFRGLKRYEYLNGVEVIRVPVLPRKKMEVATVPSMLSYFPSSVFFAVYALNGRKYDIVNTHFAIPSGPPGHTLSKLFCLPNVLSIHGGDIFDPSKSISPHKTPFLSSVVKYMLNKADRVVAQSSDTKNNAYRYYDVRRRIDIIPLGIKKPIFTKKSRDDFSIKSDQIVFCTIGRLVKRKNLNELIDILAKLKNEYEFKLIIIGDGPERTNIEATIKLHSLEDRVVLYGNVSDELKFQLLNISDCYLSTALHEGFGLIFLEAMECGLPIICYNRGGQNDFLINGKTGFLMEFREKQKFKAKISELISKPKLKDKISTYNKRLINDYYIDKCGEKYIDLFRAAISEYRR
jgi:glycosyltransferase involved in cell wall biosynthesis